MFKYEIPATVVERFIYHNHKNQRDIDLAYILRRQHESQMEPAFVGGQSARR